MPKSSPAGSAGLRSRQALIAAASAGDADAQLKLGDVYREGGRWTAQAYAEALRWDRAAAGQGEANADAGATLSTGRPATISTAGNGGTAAERRPTTSLIVQVAGTT